jgi:DNA polymerase-3 subunit epsilon
METEQIKLNKPVFNRAGRHTGNRLGLFSFEDDKGYINFKLARLSDISGSPLTTFTSKDEAISFLENLMGKYGLCQKLCALYSSYGACFHYEIKKCLGACLGEESAEEYNLRAEKAIASIGLETKSFYLFDKGRNVNEKSVVKVVNGKLIGYGYFDPSNIEGNIWLLDDLIIPCKDNRDSHFIIRSFLAKAKPGNVFYFNPESEEY